ncbi:MAG: GGDEF domain-containing protein [Aquabacterium sp.]
MPAHAIFFGLVRSGLSIRLRDPAMMVVQNVYALLTIGFAYTALYPNDRGAVLVLLPLVTVFGMFTHTPSQSVLFSTGFLVVMAIGMGVLSHVDPVFYPPQLELLRFELMIGTLPTISFAAYQITSWRAKATTQREELRRTLSKVQELATHDVLTGLYNRHFMQDKLNECIARFDRYGERFTTVLIDLDHFKRINDQFGHKVGDQALLAFAQAGRQILGEVGIMARWGGEEFLVLLPNTGTTKTLDLLRQLRAAMAQCGFSDGHPLLRVTFSAGIAIHDRPASLAATLERADRALYRAKHEGRDRDVVAPQVNS